MVKLWIAGAVIVFAAAVAAVARCRRGPVIACRIGAFTPAERAQHDALTHELHAAVASVDELADGYALHVDPRRMPESALRAWTSLEARCCPFLRMRIVQGGPELMLRLEGGPGVKAFLREEMSAGAPGLTPPAAPAR